jgi:signal transduction histidine kinase
VPPMFRVFDCIVTLHDLRFVVAAGVICPLSCVSAVNLLDRARLANGRPRIFWHGAAAAVAGSGIWATHFLDMLAYRPGLPVAYAVWPTLASIAIAVGFTWVGYAMALAGRALVGGALAGLAIGAMHYTGMMAVQIAAAPRWDAAFVVASLALGGGLAAAVMKVAVRDGPLLRRQALAATLYILAIIGLHFTAMTGLSYQPDPTLHVPMGGGNAVWVSIAVAACAALMILLGLAGSAFDKHLAERSMREAARLRDHVAALEDAKRALEDQAARLAAARDEAAAGSRAKSRFLAAMSHELRTPLNAVIGFSEAISAEPFGPLGDEKYADYAKCINDSGAHLLSLINDILDLSRLDENAMALDEDIVILASLAEESVRMVRRQAEHAGVALTVDLPADLPDLRADARRLRQVLLNLLANAVKFTPEGGAVHLSAAHEEDGLSIAISDTGIGIDSENIPKALERFGQVDDRLGRRFEGSGLGLPLSRSLMEAHGGTLELDSEPGRGTTVTVTLPPERMLASRDTAAA